MTAVERVLVPEVTGPPEAEALQALHAMLIRFDQDRQALAEAGELDDLAWGLARFRDFMKSARALGDQIEQDVARLMDAKLHEVPQLGMLERRQSAKRREWEHQRLALAVLRKAQESGEINHPDDVVRHLLAAAGIGYWKVTELRRLGLDAGDFCAEEAGRPTVYIHGGEVEL